MCGGEHSFAAQISLQIDADIVKNSRFRTETNYYQEHKILCSLFSSPPLGERVRVRGKVIYLLPSVITLYYCCKLIAVS